MAGTSVDRGEVTLAGIDDRPRPERLAVDSYVCVAEAGSVLAGAHTVVLVAAGMPGTASDGGMDDLAALDAVEAACTQPGGPRRLVAVTSALVYGAHANNPLPLVESAVLRPNEGFGAIAGVAEIERRLASLAGTANVEVTVVRPAPVVTPGTGDMPGWLTGVQPLAARGGRPARQFLHVDDLAAAVAHMIETGLGGAVNVAPTGWLSAREVDGILGFDGPAIVLPEDASRRVRRRLARSCSTISGEDTMPFTRFACVVSNTRLVASGFEPEHSNAASLRVAREVAHAAQRRGSKARRRPLLAIVAACITVVGASWVLRRSGN